MVLKIFPGITEATVNAVFNIPGLRAVVLETFGTGNAPRKEWFFNALKKANEKGIIIINRSQCNTGSVEMGRYETSLNLMQAGVMSAYDCTVEAIVTKLMLLLGEYDNLHEVKHKLSISIRGEMTVI